jgi:hypothetical protein
MKKHSIVPILAATALLLGLGSCTKVIDVAIRDSDTRIVIEGVINNVPGPHTVRVSTSTNFDAAGTGASIDNAVVTITNGMLTDTLRPVGNGNYQTHRITGTPGQTYTLRVVANGNTYLATSTMPQPILLDELAYETAGPHGKVLQASYDDPGSVANYYQFVVFFNDQRQKPIYVTDDRLRNGIRARTPITLNNDIKTVDKNDLFRVEMRCIDAGVFDYLKSLSDVLGGQAVSPANPNSNLSGGALGYFSAQTTSSRSLTIR